MTTTTTTKNWMLDETIKTVRDCRTKSELIKKLTIQKIEYGRICMNQLLASHPNINCVPKSLQTIHKELDKELQKRIDEVKNLDDDAY